MKLRGPILMNQGEENGQGRVTDYCKTIKKRSKKIIEGVVCSVKVEMERLVKER